MNEKTGRYLGTRLLVCAQVRACVCMCVHAQCVLNENYVMCACEHECMSVMNVYVCARVHVYMCDNNMCVSVNYGTMFFFF